MEARRWRGIWIVAFIAVIVFIVILAMVGQSNSSNAASTPTAAAKATPVSSSNCWTVVLNPNAGYRVLSAGVPSDKRATAATTLSYLLDNAKLDPRALLAMTDAYDQRNNIPQLPANYWHTWVTGNCYNAAGQAQWYLTSTNYQLASLQIAPAPAVGCNYSVTPGGNPTCKVETIGGNRSGISITFQNSATLYVMYRCGNPVIPGSAPAAAPPPSTTLPAPTPVLPAKPVTPVKPVKPVTPTPTTTPTTAPCPTGQHPSPLNGTCIAPKDPSQDPLNNPNVPPIVKGPGTTPAGQAPTTPATPPVDSPTGCNGACTPSTTATTSPPASTVTTVTSPPSSSGATQPVGTANSGDPGAPPSS